MIGEVRQLTDRTDRTASQESKVRLYWITSTKRKGNGAQSAVDMLRVGSDVDVVISKIKEMTSRDLEAVVGDVGVDESP